MPRVRVLVVGLGQMGLSHALSYHLNPGYEIIGLVNRSMRALPEELHLYKVVRTFEEGLVLKPDLVSINTHADTHASFAIAAMEAGAHVFVEKPVAANVEDAKQVVEVAQRLQRKLVVGYILRHHPVWTRFIECARELGAPYVMRFNLNQQSSGDTWAGHKRILECSTPVVDVGVHYVDVMLQISSSRPIQVRGMGVRLARDIPDGQVNYAHLQVLFEDGSVGWFESGFGPMISENAFFIKDVFGRNGSASIVTDGFATGVDINVQTLAARIRHHRSHLTPTGDFASPDNYIDVPEQPDHQGLCDRQQQFVLDAINGDLDLNEHMEDAIRSLVIVLAADASINEGRAMEV